MVNVLRARTTWSIHALREEGTLRLCMGVPMTITSARSSSAINWSDLADDPVPGWPASFECCMDAYSASMCGSVPSPSPRAINSALGFSRTSMSTIFFESFRLSDNSPRELNVRCKMFIYWYSEDRFQGSGDAFLMRLDRLASVSHGTTVKTRWIN